MGKKKVSPQKKEVVSFNPPPSTLNEHVDFSKGVRMQGVVDQSRLTLRPAPLDEIVRHQENGKDTLSDYKKKLFLKNTLDNEDDVPAGAIKARNKMLLCEMAAQGKWSNIQSLIDLVELNVNEPDEEGELALCAAAAHGHDSVVIKLFRDYRVNIVAQRQTDGYSALIAAAEAGELKCVIVLLECARILPVRVAYDHLKLRVKGKPLDARAVAVKCGRSAIVEAIDQEEKLVLGRPVNCRHKCGIRISFGEQKVHENELCPVFTCLCVNGCGERVRRSYMDIHQGYECVKRIRAPSPR